MNNSRKNFSILLTVAIIIVALIVWGVYVLIHHKQSMQSSQSTISPTNTTSSNQPFNANHFSPQQYTDNNFGFTLSYPGDWQLKSIPVDQIGGEISQAMPLSGFIIGNVDSVGNIVPQISLFEAHSSSLSITDVYGPRPNLTYFFDPSIHTWMTVEKNPWGIVASTTADVSINTMGGLHMFGQHGQYSTMFIPLSAENFLVINDIGSVDSTFLAKTIVATDPSVATPISADQQASIIQAELNAYIVKRPTISWNTYVDSYSRFSFQYPSQFEGGRASLEPNNLPQVFVTDAGNNIDSQGCYTTANAMMSRDKDIQKTINGISFCISKSGDVGMSQLYNTTYYTTNHNGEYITLSYSVHTSNGCGVYQGNPSYPSCQYFFDNYDTFVTQPIEKSVSTLMFSSPSL